jgi:RNA polymerase sigma-70 factor (ECF subfamily)
MIDSERGLELHLLIKVGNDLALAKLYDCYGGDIVSALRRWYPNLAKDDNDYFLEAVNEAFFGYYKNPYTFDPGKSTLKRFLEVAAERDLLNILEREKRHTGKENLPEDVELEEIFWNTIKRDTQSIDEKIIARETMDWIHKELANHFPLETDLVLAKMILQGVRETDAFAEALQIEKLQREEQKKEVKRHKDRIIKVMERNQVVLKIKKYCNER